MMGVRRYLALMAWGWLLSATHAFPPSPPHLLYGMVRDEMGNPLSLDGAIVILESSGEPVKIAAVGPDAEEGINYRLSVPNDAGVTSDSYRADALNASTPFRLHVQIGETVYLPIEMSGDFQSLGQPSEATRLDLTLGEDADGDGLPDAWEAAMLAAASGLYSVVNPDEDSDNDGLTNLQEYQAGTQAFDSRDGFSLKVVEMSPEAATMEFMAIRGRSYSIYASADLGDWEPVPFRLEGESSEAPERDAYQASYTELLRIKAAPSSEHEGLRFFKLRVD